MSARDDWEKPVALSTAGDVPGAVAACRALWERTGGPAPVSEENNLLREFARGLNVWEQIELFVTEVDARPHNPRSWKLLAYGYTWAGLYVPALLRAAEQAFLVSAAHDDAAAAVMEEKIELCRRALAGEAEARAELAAGERTFAKTFNVFPASVPLPRAFITMGIATGDELKLTAAVVAPDLLDLLGG